MEIGSLALFSYARRRGCEGGREFFLVVQSPSHLKPQFLSEIFSSRLKVRRLVLCLAIVVTNLVSPATSGSPS